MRPGEVAIENDRLRLTVLPDFGAAVTAFTLKRDGGEVDIFRPWDGTPDNPSRLASINLIPWSNRISGGGITVGSRFYPLKPNREGEPYPIHGDGFQQAWRVVETRPDLIHLAIESAVQAPYDYRAHVVYGLSPTALTMRMEVEHQGDEPALYGMGFHPWFPRTPGVTLEAPARTVWLETEDHLPAGAVPVAERPEWDFSTAKAAAPDPGQQRLHRLAGPGPDRLAGAGACRRDQGRARALDLHALLAGPGLRILLLRAGLAPCGRVPPAGRTAGERASPAEPLRALRRRRGTHGIGIGRSGHHPSPPSNVNGGHIGAHRVGGAP